jgi:N-acetylmuramoyl-L-alanine amidase
MLGRYGCTWVVLLGADLAAMTARSVVTPPRPISTATAAALVATAAKSNTRLIPAANRVAVVAAASPPARLARCTKIVLNPGHNGGNWSHPGVISRQVPAGFGRYKHCDTVGTATNTGFSGLSIN